MTSPRTAASRRAVAGALVVALTGLAGCSGGEPTDTASPTPEPTSAALPSGDPTEGVAVGSDGYELAAPPGWEDATEEYQERFGQVDTAAQDTATTGGFADNVNVIVSEKRRIKSQRKAERILRTELEQIGSKVRIQEPGELDGEVAYHATARLKVGKLRIRTTQFFAKHDKAWYLVTFSYGPSTDAETEAEEIQSMLDSWTWE